MQRIPNASLSEHREIIHCLCILTARTEEVSHSRVSRLEKKGQRAEQKEEKEQEEGESSSER